MFSRPFRKHRVIPLAAFMWVYKKGEIAKPKKMGSVLKGIPHKYYHGKTGRYPGCCWHCYKQGSLRARFLPGELIWMLSILNTLRTRIACWDIEATWSEKERSQREGYQDPMAGAACSTQRTTLCPSQ